MQKLFRIIIVVKWLILSFLTRYMWSKKCRYYLNSKQSTSQKHSSIDNLLQFIAFPNKSTISTQVKIENLYYHNILSIVHNKDKHELFLLCASSQWQQLMSYWADTRSIGHGIIGGRGTSNLQTVCFTYRQDLAIWKKPAR